MYLSVPESGMEYFANCSYTSGYDISYLTGMWFRIRLDSLHQRQERVDLVPRVTGGGR